MQRQYLPQPHGGICLSGAGKAARAGGRRSLPKRRDDGFCAEQPGVHNGTVRQLKRENIPYFQRGSRNIRPEDYAQFDYLLGMTRSHVLTMQEEFGGDPAGKVRRLLDFSRHPRDVDDPWYTGDFVTAYRDIEEGCNALLDELFPGSREKTR